MARLQLPLLLALLLLATLSTTAAADPTDQAVRRVALQLQCPVCEGQTVADSNSGLARDMRAVIRARLAAGDSDQQILDGFVASYGEGILTEPPKRGVGLGVWFGPLLALAFGAAVLAIAAGQWRRRARGAGQPAAPAWRGGDPAVADELRRLREELGR